MLETLDFREDERQLELDEDIGSINQDEFSSAVVSGTDWTTETLINQINKGNIKLNPNFQRRDAWDKRRKSKFIESLILGFPIPQIVLAESKERRGSYIVLDGKQRLLSIRQFAASDEDDQYEKLKLTSLDIKPELKGKSLESLKNDLSSFDDLSAFENQPIRTIVIKNWPNENFLYHVFLRLNTGSVPLSPQELRQALHPGKFITFLDKVSSNSNALREILKLKDKPDFRMRDAELMLRYLAFRNFLPDYTGILKKFLDQTCKKLNSNWSLKEEEIKKQVQSFENAHLATTQIFKESAYRKWSGNAYENRFNRSVFDIMVLSFSDDKVREAAIDRKELVENTFKELCESNSNFRKSLESTTKSLGATHTRISLWYLKMNEVLNVNLNIPKLEKNRIV